MIIKPAFGGRIFWCAAALTLFITAFAGLAIFPPGLVLTCLALPLGICSLLYALGFSKTRVHNQGIVSQNFFLIKKYFKWAEIEEGKAYVQHETHTDSAGLVKQQNKKVVSFRKGRRWIHIDGQTHTSETKDWWNSLIDMSKEKLGEKFTDQR